MKSRNLFFIFILLSPLGLFTDIQSISGNDSHTVSLNDGIVLGDNNSSKKGIVKSIMLSENLVMENYDKFTNYLDKTQNYQDRIMVSERSPSMSRNRIVYEESIVNEKKQVTISEYLETITDYFYEGHTDKPQLPQIPIQIEKIPDISIQEMITLEAETEKENHILHSPSVFQTEKLANNLKFSSLALAQLQKDSNYILENEISAIPILIVSVSGILFVIKRVDDNTNKIGRAHV